jgi:MFS family permease
MDKSKLFVASCVSLVTTAMSFAVRADVADTMSGAFHLTHEQLGLIFSPAFWCFTVAIVISGAIVDTVGMRTLHILSAIGYFVGVGVIVFAPRPAGPMMSIFDTQGTTLLFAGFSILGLSQGLVEGVVNPLIATVYRGERTRRLNMLHAWWPGGMIIGGLVAVAMTRAFHAAWELKMATILAPALVYLLLALSLEYPQTERVQSCVSTREMWREAGRPLFVLLFCCMLMTSSMELGPDEWFPPIMSALVPELQGVLYLAYTAGLMFLVRTFGSGVAHKSPICTLLVCSGVAAVGLYWLGGLKAGATSPLTALIAATVFGIGKSLLWPTMLGVTADRFPRGGALAISLMGGAGMASVAVVVPIMGACIDHYGQGAALQMMAAPGAVLVVAFLGLLIYFKSRGPLRQQLIGTPPTMSIEPCSRDT